MKIALLNEHPSIEELADVIRTEFSDRYSCELLAIGKTKSIFVKKSALVVVQIQKADKENEIILEGTLKPSVLSFFYLLFDVLLSGGNILLGLPFRSRRRKLEQEIGDFIKQKYS